MNQFGRQPPVPEPVTVSTDPRRYAPKKFAHRPPGSSWRRRITGVLAAAALTIGGGIASAGPSAGAEPEQSYIVVLKDHGDNPASTAAAHAGAYGFTPSGIYRDAVNGYAAVMTAADARRLQADPAVDFVTAGREFDRPQDPEASGSQVFPLWWQRIGGGEAGIIRDANHQRSSIAVNVAVIDSGIDASHPDLNVRGGVDCTSGSPVVVTPVDVLGHGTMVAGVIAARNNDLGIIGAAPGAPLWSARVVDDAGAISEQSVICAVDWVTSTRRDQDPDNDIQVVNISLGGGGTDTEDCGRGSDPTHYAVCRSVRAGIAYVVSAGNAGVDFADTVPATYDQVLTVTGMADFDGQPGGQAEPVCGIQNWGAFGQKDDQAAFFSNFATGSKDKAHTVAGPGVCMLSTAPGGYAVNHGTSFASPAVAGSLALCISEGECEGSGQAVVEEFLEATNAYNQKYRGHGFDGDPLRPIGARYYGYLTQVVDF